MKPAAITAAALLAGCSMHMGDLSDSGIYTVTHDNGGEAQAEYLKWQERSKTAKGFVIDGACISSCAHFVMGGRTCYTENARIGMHPATYGLVVRTEFTRRFDQMILDSWPEGLQRLWADKVPEPDFGAGLIGYDATIEVLREYWPEGECKPGFFDEVQS